MIQEHGLHDSLLWAAVDGVPEDEGMAAVGEAMEHMRAAAKRGDDVGEVLFDELRRRAVPVIDGTGTPEEELSVRAMWAVWRKWSNDEQAREVLRGEISL